MMKLITAIVQDEDAEALLDALVRKQYRATKIGSTGGFLRRGNSTIFVGIEDEAVDTVIETIRDSCRTRTQLLNPALPGIGPELLQTPYQVEVEVGGATIFVQDVERFVRV
jgi:uncharacterized protein YaaQ